MDRIGTADITDYRLSLVTYTDLVTQEIMTFLSYATTKDEKDQEATPNLSFKPMVLPPITMAMKTIWKANKVKLEKAGIFYYVCWIQSITRLAYTGEVIEFVKMHSMSIEIAQVNGRTIDFSVKTVGRLLRLPGDGLAWDQLPGLTKKHHETMFEGEFPQSPKGCQFDKAKHH